jgi:hypothetical protein
VVHLVSDVNPTMANCHITIHHSFAHCSDPELSRRWDLTHLVCASSAQQPLDSSAAGFPKPALINHVFCGIPYPDRSPRPLRCRSIVHLLHSCAIFCPTRRKTRRHLQFFNTDYPMDRPAAPTRTNSEESGTRKLRGACDSCHNSKVRCSGGNPCTKCRDGLVFLLLSASLSVSPPFH